MAENGLTQEQLREELQPLHEKLDTLESIVRGNGRPEKGRVARVHANEQTLNQWEKNRQEQRQRENDNRRWRGRLALTIIGSIFTLIATGLSTLVSLWLGR